MTFNDNPSSSYNNTYPQNPNISSHTNLYCDEQAASTYIFNNPQVNDSSKFFIGHKNDPNAVNDPNNIHRRQNLNNIYNINNGGAANPSSYYYKHKHNNKDRQGSNSESPSSFGPPPPIYAGWLVSNMVSSPLIVTNLVLGLHTLTVFLVDSCDRDDNTGLLLLPFVKDAVLPYFEHPSGSVRMEAVRTATTVLRINYGVRVRRGAKATAGGPTPLLFSQILKKVISTLVADPSPGVRVFILRELGRIDQGFFRNYYHHHCQQNKLVAKKTRARNNATATKSSSATSPIPPPPHPLTYLATPEVLSTLLPLLSPSSPNTSPSGGMSTLPVSLAALNLLATLTPISPGAILPALRTVLKNLISVCQIVERVSEREDAIKMLLVYLRRTELQRLVLPFLRSLISVLPLNQCGTSDFPKMVVNGTSTLSNENDDAAYIPSGTPLISERLIASSMAAIGSLSLIMRKPALSPWTRSYILPSLVKLLSSPNSPSSRRRVALRTIGEVLISTGECMEDTYGSFEVLMPEVLSQLGSGNSSSSGTSNSSNLSKSKTQAMGGNTGYGDWGLRCEVLRLLGICGAIDPVRLAEIQEHNALQNDDSLHYSHRTRIRHKKDKLSRKLENGSQGYGRSTAKAKKNSVAPFNPATIAPSASVSGGVGAVGDLVGVAITTTAAGVPTPTLFQNNKQQRLNAAREYRKRINKKKRKKKRGRGRSDESDNSDAVSSSGQTDDEKTKTTPNDNNNSSSKASTNNDASSDYSSSSSSSDSSDSCSGDEGPDSSSDEDGETVIKWRKSRLELEPAHWCMYEQSAMTAQPAPKYVKKIIASPSSDDFYPTVAVKALMEVLKDPSLSVHHSMVMQSVMFIFNSLGLRCIMFLDLIIPHILAAIKNPSTQLNLRELLLQQLATVANIVQQHLRPYMQEIFVIATQYWNDHMPACLALLENMAVKTPDDFNIFLPTFVRHLLSSVSFQLGNVLSEEFLSKVKLVCNAVKRLKTVLSDSLQLIVPRLIKLLDVMVGGDMLGSFASNIDKRSKKSSKQAYANKTTNSAVYMRRQLIENTSITLIKTITYVMRGNNNFSNTRQSLPTSVAHPLLRILGKCNFMQGVSIVECIFVIAREIGSTWPQSYHVSARTALFDWVNTVPLPPQMGTNYLDPAIVVSEMLRIYENTVSILSLGGDFGGYDNNSSAFHFQQFDRTLALCFPSATRFIALTNADYNAGGVGGKGEGGGGADFGSGGGSSSPPAKLRVSQQNLQRAWDVSQRSTREDWDEWMRRFAVQLLREAPSPALRACADLAQAYPPLARELFEAAFVSCWFELADHYQDNLVRSFETAFRSETIPQEILQTLLNLAEFMEHDVEALPIDIRVLAELAIKCRAYAKALHYKELEYKKDPKGCVEALISINKKLDLSEAALGVLKALQNMELDEEDESDDEGYYEGEENIINDVDDVGPIPTNVMVGGGRRRLGSKEVEVELEAEGKRDDGEGEGDKIDENESSCDKSDTCNNESNGGNNNNNQEEDDDVDDVASNELDDEASLVDDELNQFHGMEVKENYLAKLGSWSEALVLYKKRLREDDHDVSSILGCMRCLDARGEYEGVLKLAKNSFGVLQNALVGDDGETSDTINGGAAHDYKKAVKFCSHAAWRLGKWKKLEQYCGELERVESSFDGSGGGGGGSFGEGRNLFNTDFDSAFYTAVLRVHRKDWDAASDAINAARLSMDSRFTALMAESYTRAYPLMVNAQLLSEMEEIIELQKMSEKSKINKLTNMVTLNDPALQKKRLLKTWKKRLKGCKVDAGVHNSVLAVRSLILKPTDDIESTLTLAALCRQAQNYKLCEKVLSYPLKALKANLNGIVFGFKAPAEVIEGGISNKLRDRQVAGIGNHTAIAIDRVVVGIDDTRIKYTSIHDSFADKILAEAGSIHNLHSQHQLYYARVKHMWATGRTKQAMRRLELLCDTIDLVSHCKNITNNQLRMKCWLKLGNWKLSTITGGAKLEPELQFEVIKSYKRATLAGSDHYKSWHAWALLNFRLTKQWKKYGQRDAIMPGLSSHTRHTHTPSRYLRNHIVASAQGFLKAISLGKKRWSASVQQDILNFLTVLFSHGELKEVADTINKNKGGVKLEMWLGVLPQLLARIQVKSINIRKVVHGLLIKLGEKHPQALMYPLSVLLKSPVVERKAAAESLMQSLRSHSELLVEQSLLVSNELIRIAISWHEMWHEGLEEASRFYFGEGNISGMLDVLLPLHQQLENGPKTRRESQFVEAFGKDLGEAHKYIQKYVRLTTEGGETVPTFGGYSSNSNSGGGEEEEEEEVVRATEGGRVNSRRPRQL